MRFVVFIAMLLSVSVFGSPVRSSLGAERNNGAEPLPYNAEVEFLESTGTQYIDTGIAMDYAHVTFGGTFSTSSAGTGGFAIGFSLKAIASYTRSFEIEQNANARAMFKIVGGTTIYGNMQSGLSTSPCSVDFSQSPHTVTIDGVDSTFTSTDWDAGNIFAFGTGSVFGSVRIHSIWIRQDGELVCDMIPVTISNEQGDLEGVMYDRVTGAFFHNQGEGQFVIGPDKAK